MRRMSRRGFDLRWLVVHCNTHKYTVDTPRPAEFRISDFEIIKRHARKIGSRFTVE
jgi:hypothetical protein